MNEADFQRIVAQWLGEKVYSRLKEPAVLPAQAGSPPLHATEALARNPEGHPALTPKPPRGWSFTGVGTRAGLMGSAEYP